MKTVIKFVMQIINGHAMHTFLEKLMNFFPDIELTNTSMVHDQLLQLV